MTFLERASYTIKLNFPSDYSYNSKAPQNFINYTLPYLPPGIALSKDLGGKN